MRRVERAIETGSITELEWSEDYCNMRLSMGHSKQWDKLLNKVEERLDAIYNQDDVSE